MPLQYRKKVLYLGSEWSNDVPNIHTTDTTSNNQDRTVYIWLRPHEVNRMLNISLERRLGVSMKKPSVFSREIIHSRIPIWTNCNNKRFKGPINLLNNHIF